MANKTNEEKALEREQFLNDNGMSFAQAGNLQELSAMNSAAAGKRVPKKFRRGGSTDPHPTTNSNSKDAYISDVIETLMHYYYVPKARNADDVIDRLNQYFQYCADKQMRPTVESMALCLGIDAGTMKAWERGEGLGRQFKEIPDIIRRARSLVAAMDAELVAAGKLNPVTYIFRAKNYYGMSDVSEKIITAAADKPQLTNADIEKELLDEL